MIGLLTQDAQLAAIAPEWAGLHARATAAPFQSPAWLLAWWAVFGTGQPRVATWRAPDGRLDGLLATYVLPDEGKTLSIGAGLSDRLDVLLDPAAPPEAASALLTAVLCPPLPCHLIELPTCSPLLRAQTPWPSATVTGEICPVLPLTSDLRETVPVRQHRKLRMARHRAAEAGGFTVEAVTPETLAGMFADLTRLHGARWRARGEAGVLDDPAVQAFHARALPALLAAGLLRMRAVRLRGQVAAVIHAMVDVAGRIHFYLSGFDEAFARESPGTLLLGAMLEEAVAEGRHEAHFLRGGETYKFAWGAQPTRNATRLLTPP